MRDREFISPSRDSIVSTIPKHSGLDETVVDEFVRRTDVALARYAEGWLEYYEVQCRKAEAAIEHVDAALVILQGAADRLFSLDIETETPEVATAESLCSALQSTSSGEPSAALQRYFEHVGEPQKSLWLAREVLRLERKFLLDLEHRNNRNVTPLPDIGRCHIDEAARRLIAELCAVWQDSFSDLPLPRKDPGRLNPLIRYIDLALSSAMGEDRPRPEALVNFISKTVKPEIVRRARLSLS